MKTLFASGYLLFFVLLIFAAPPENRRKFDIVSFIAPAGWNAAEDRDHATFTTIDETGKTFAMLAVYASTERSVSAEKDFAGEWKNVVARSFTAGGAPSSSAGRTRSGLEFREGSAAVTQQGGQPAYVRLMVFPAGRRIFSVLAIGTHRAALDARQSAVQAFIDSLVLNGQETAVHQQTPPGAANAAAGNQPGVQTSGAPRSATGIAGVWMGFRQVYGYEPTPRWYTFYEDGQVFEDIPRTGYLGFSRDTSQADSAQHGYWGSYTFAGGAGAISKPGVKFIETLKSEGPEQLKIDSTHFYRCRTVNGLRLQGAWTSYANPNDPDLDRRPEGQRPVFRFTGTGQFMDEGVFATFLKSNDPRQDAAGQGTYEIRDFTLVLRYGDGRVKHLAVTGVLGADPASSNDMIFIARSVFRKRK